LLVTKLNTFEFEKLISYDSNEVLGQFNLGSNEYECDECGSSCIEYSGQRLEDFLVISEIGDDFSGTETPPEPAILANNSSDSDGTDDVGSVLIQRIVNRVLGIGVQTRPSVHTTLLTVLEQTAMESGRPVGIVVRQAASPRELSLLNSVFGTENFASLPPGIEGSTTPSLVNNGTNESSRQRSLLSLPSPFDFLGSAMEGRGFEDLLHHLMMNEASHAGSPPATEEDIRKLPKIKISSPCNMSLSVPSSEVSDKSKFGVCCISQESFEEGDIAVQLPCEHSFKETPIIQWLRRHNTCPVCRHPI